MSFNSMGLGVLMKDKLGNGKLRGTGSVWYKLLEAYKTSNGIQPHTPSLVNTLMVTLLHQVIFHT